MAVLAVGQALEGVLWGFFIANSPAYASEFVPLVLRAACTATLQMSWSIGGIIVAGATYGYNKRDDQWTWRVPSALQCIFLMSVTLPALQPEAYLFRHRCWFLSSLLHSYPGDLPTKDAKKKPFTQSGDWAARPKRRP